MVSPKGMEGGTGYRTLVALSLPGTSQAQSDGLLTSVRELYSCWHSFVQGVN